MKAKTAASSLSLSDLANFQSGCGAVAASLRVLSQLPGSASASRLIKYSIYTFNTPGAPPGLTPSLDIAVVGIKARDQIT